MGIFMPLNRFQNSFTQHSSEPLHILTSPVISMRSVITMAAHSYTYQKNQASQEKYRKETLYLLLKSGSSIHPFNLIQPLPCPRFRLIAGLKSMLLITLIFCGLICKGMNLL